MHAQKTGLGPDSLLQGGKPGRMFSVKGSSSWTPASFGSNLKGWWKADAGLFAQTAASFASASSESLSHAGNATLRGQSGTGGFWRAGWFRLTTLAATLWIQVFFG